MSSQAPRTICDTIIFVIAIISIAILTAMLPGCAENKYYAAVLAQIELRQQELAAQRTGPAAERPKIVEHKYTDIDGQEHTLTVYQPDQQVAAPATELPHIQAWWEDLFEFAVRIK